jgi:hypothetical protein
MDLPVLEAALESTERRNQHIVKNRLYIQFYILDKTSTLYTNQLSQERDYSTGIVDYQYTVMTTTSMVLPIVENIVFRKKGQRERSSRAQFKPIGSVQCYAFEVLSSDQNEHSSMAFPSTSIGILS